MRFLFLPAFWAVACASPAKPSTKSTTTTTATPTTKSTPSTTLVTARRSPTTGANLCTVVDFLVTDGGVQREATQFCSYYLHIPEATSSSTVTVASISTTTATVTSATVTVQGSTTTTTTTTTSTNSVVVTVPSSTTTTSTSFTTTVTVTSGGAGSCTAPATVAKRTASAAVAKPDVFSAYSGGILSSACSCLSIPPGTTTATVTQTTAGGTSTKTSSVTATVTNYATSIVTSTITAATTSTFTSVTIISSVVMTATTVTVAGTPTTPASFYMLDGTNGMYGVNDGDQLAFSASSTSAALAFTYDAVDGTVAYGEALASIPASDNPSEVTFAPSLIIFNNGDIVLPCVLSEGTEDCTLTCTGPAGQIANSLDGSDNWYVNTPGNDETSGTEFTIYVVDAGS